MSSILGKLGTVAGNMRSGFLSVLGLGGISYAIGMYDLRAGIIAGGVSLLLIDLAREKVMSAEAGRR